MVKVPSTPADPSLAFLQALEALGEPLGRVASLVHGTTVATNAIIQRAGATCGLIATRGFRDVLELRRRDRPTLYGLTGFFEPLIPRELRLEVDERTDPGGRVLVPVAEEEVRAATRQLAAQGVRVIIVGFLHSYANPDNERRARAMIEKIWPDGPVVVSSEVLPEMREFERLSTAVVNAYVLPIIGGYLGALAGRLAERGFRRELLLVQSNGGVLAAELARRFPVMTILSGPAAGVIAGAAIARAAGFPHAITCDMGGTSFDVALVWDGAPRFAEEQHVEFGIPIRTPHIDMTTIGAGGGSIARIDRGGMLRVGPDSAGAEPGPACYGRGGRKPTVSDAHVALGHIDPESPIARESGIRLDGNLARSAIEEKVARPLGLGIEEASAAILTVADSHMAGSIRQVSVERGFDPRDFVLVAFGGAGPLHVCALMREVDIGHGIVPRYPGATSALGCLVAHFRHDLVQTLNLPLATLDAAAVSRVLGEQREGGLALLREEGHSDGEPLVLHEADMAYQGQVHTVRVPLPATVVSRDEIGRRFDERYREAYGGLLSGYPVLLTNVRTTVVGPRPAPALGSTVPAGTGDAARVRSRQAYFAGKFHECPVYGRDAMPAGLVVPGPAVVEQADTTVLIEPGFEAQVDPLGHLLVRRP